MYSRRKQPYPCDSYFGNLCGGFGGTLDCHGCGWDRFEHGNDRIKKEWVRQELKKYKFDEFRANHPDKFFKIEHNLYHDWWEVTDNNGVQMEIISPSEDIEKTYQQYLQYHKEKSE